MACVPFTVCAGDSVGEAGFPSAACEQCIAASATWTKVSKGEISLESEGPRHHLGHLTTTGRRRHLARFKDNNFTDRLSAQAKAKQALLDKFKTRPAPDSPEMQAKLAERKAVAEAREQREAERKRLKQEQIEREAAEKAAREAAEEAERNAEALAREQADKDRISRLLADEAERKAARDARYAARKARVKR